jgi:hypothetical protein
LSARTHNAPRASADVIIFFIDASIENKNIEKLNFPFLRLSR